MVIFNFVPLPNGHALCMYIPYPNNTHNAKNMPE